MRFPQIRAANSAETAKISYPAQLTPRPETERKGTPDDGDDADGDKGDSASPGSGDNSKRYGDMNGSLTGSDVKPKASAGTDGREDRGASSSAGRSTNHGQSSSIGIKNDSGSASEKRRQKARIPSERS